MAQGLLKKSKPTTATAKRGSNARTKPGPRQIAPKKASLVKQHKLNKKLTSGLAAKTERSLAQKAGHLEMLSGGKKEKDGKGKKK